MVNRPYSTCIDFVLLMKERGGKICAITLHVSKIIINGYSPITLHQTIIILMHFEVDEKPFGAGAFLVNFLDKVRIPCKHFQKECLDFSPSHLQQQF